MGNSTVLNKQDSCQIISIEQFNTNAIIRNNLEKCPLLRERDIPTQITLVGDQQWISQQKQKQLQHESTLRQFIQPCHTNSIILPQQFLKVAYVNAEFHVTFDFQIRDQQGQPERLLLLFTLNDQALSKHNRNIFQNNFEYEDIIIFNLRQKLNQENELINEIGTLQIQYRQLFNSILKNRKRQIIRSSSSDTQKIQSLSFEKQQLSKYAGSHREISQLIDKKSKQTFSQSLSKDSKDRSRKSIYRIPKQ